MIRVFVKRPVTTMMLVLFMVLLGAVAVLDLNIEKDPKIDFPMVSIQITYPGATPLEVEEEVLKKVEDAISEVSGIKKVNGQALENVGILRIEFEIENDVNIKLLEVKDKVDAIINDLPSSIEKPVISKIDVLAQAVMDIVLTSDKHNTKQLYDYADKVLKSNFNSVKGMSTVEIIGGDLREIRISLDSELMKQQFITITDVVEGLNRANISVSGGEVIQFSKAINVKFYSEFQSMDDIKNVIFTTQEGKKFKLSSIAVVEDSIADRELTALFNGQDTVLISLKNAADGNAIQISAEVMKRLPKLNANMPDGMKLEVVNDTSSTIKKETEDTVYNILLGMVLTVVIILVFTANISSTFITALIIPTSLIATMFLVSMSGFTINSMTLLALACVLGTLIANAIIIIESALTLMAQGKTAEEAAIEGTQKVILPVFASSGTNLAVFIPIAFMGGIVGKFMVQFGMTVVYATILSIVISFSLTPMLIAKLIKVSSKKRLMDKFSDWLNDFLIGNYKTVFDFIWRFKIIGLLISIAIMWSSLTLVKYLGNEMMPINDQDKLTVVLVTPEGSTIENTTEKIKIINEKARQIPEVLSTVAKIGVNGTTNATLLLNLLPLAERSKSDVEVATMLIQMLADIPDISIDIQRSNGQAELALNVYGKDYDKIVAYSKEIETRLHSLNVFRSITSSFREPKNERRFIPNQAKLNEYGVNNAQIANAIRVSIYGDTSNQYRDSGETYDINILLNEYSRNNAKVFENIYVNTPKGLVPINRLGSIEEVKAFSDITRRDRERIIEISAYLGKSSLGKVQLSLEKVLSDIEFEEGYGYMYGGSSEIQEEIALELGKAFLLAVILTYMVLAAVLNSYIHPFTIAVSIITSFSGVFVMMFFVDSTINMGSMLSMIMLIGLSVNNAILVVELAISKINEGWSIKDAIWEGFREKMRTIFMTSIAIMLGMVPQLFATDVTKSSMAAVVIGGMIGSILFTLILTPIVFYAMEKLRTIGRVFKKVKS